MAKGYAKIWRRLWDDEVFQTLENTDKLAVFFLLTRCSNRVGIFVVPLAELAAEVGLEEEEPACGYAVGDLRVGIGAVQVGGQAVGRLSAAFRWPWHQPTRTLWIKSWWKWNTPESPSALTGYLKELSDLPRSPVLDDYVRATPNFTNSLAAAWREAHDSLSRAWGTACPHPEPEPEPEQEPETEDSRDVGLETETPEILETQQRRAEVSAPRCRLPTIRGTDFLVTGAHVSTFADAYPAVDVMQELNAMAAWLISNPTKRKTARGMLRFVNGWLSKQQDRGPRANSNGVAADEREGIKLMKRSDIENDTRD